jgi:hypothetical protein
MKTFIGSTVEFKQGAPDVMEVYSLGKDHPLLGKIKLGDKPYKLETEQHAKFSSEQLAEISGRMHD